MALSNRHSLANRDSCPTPAKNEGNRISTKLDPQKLDILSLGRYLFYLYVVSVNRNIVRYNKYLVVVTVVVVFVSYSYSNCDFVRTFYSRYWCVQVQLLVPYLFYF